MSAPLTTAQAAVLYGLKRESFTREMRRQRTKGRDFRRPVDEWPDARTPLWDAGALEVWLASRGRKQ